MYKVISRFKDLKDNEKVYEVGDKYPRRGYKPTQKRIDELASEKNKLGYPLIEKQ